MVGFSNELLSELSDPPLTVIDMHHETIGRRALEVLLQHTEGPDRSSLLTEGIEIIPAALIVRQSTARPDS